MREDIYQNLLDQTKRLKEEVAFFKKEFVVMQEKLTKNLSELKEVPEFKNSFDIEMAKIIEEAEEILAKKPDSNIL